MLSSFSYCLNTSAGSRISCAAKCPAWWQSSSFLWSPSSYTSAAQIMDLDKSFCESRSGRTSKVMDGWTDRFTTSSNTLAYVRVITVNGHTIYFIFLKYNERLLLKGLMLNGFEIYPTLRLPLKSFWVRSVTKTNKQQKFTRTQFAKTINCWGLLLEGFWKD